MPARPGRVREGLKLFFIKRVVNGDDIPTLAVEAGRDMMRRVVKDILLALAFILACLLYSHKYPFITILNYQN